LPATDSALDVRATAAAFMLVPVLRRRRPAEGVPGDPRPAARPKHEPLTDAEQAYLSNQLTTAAVIARGYTAREEELPSLASLDATWRAWHNDTSEARVDANAFVNAIGAALGQHLVRDLSLDWAIISDDFGTDLGLFGEPGAITVFPVNMLVKRIDEAESPVRRLHEATLENVRRVRTARRAYS
jgi:hypothetical protein